MNDLVVKSVDLFGDSVMAAKDREGTIWVGVNYFCQGLEMNKKQRDWQIEKIKEDKTLSKGSRLLPAGIFDASHGMYALRLDFVPLWLAKITITKKMEQDHPELSDKLLEYQLKAKDILADAFLPINNAEATEPLHPSEILLGELASYLKAMDRVAHRQNLAPYKIAENFKKVSRQFGVELTDDFVNIPDYEQMELICSPVQAAGESG